MRGGQTSSVTTGKSFCNAVTLLISKGYTSDTAIDQIYLVYGEGKSVGQILKLMAEGRRHKVYRL